MRFLEEASRRPASLADHLPWAALVAPGIILNKDGSFQRTARFRGPDLESSTEAELMAVSARLNNALRRLGSGWALFVEADRRPLGVEGAVVDVQHVLHRRHELGVPLRRQAPSLLQPRLQLVF